MWKRTSKPRRSARSYALWLLGRKSYSVLALRQRLERRGYSPQESSDAVAYLVNIGYLNDQTFAADFVQTRSQAGYGTRKLDWELRSRGISPEDAELALATLDEQELKQQAQRLAGRKLSLASDHDPVKLRQRLLRYLLQRGYEYPLAEEVIADLMASLDRDG
ncbi:MAG: regulatory protein RecX [Bacillota bacterium]